MVADDSVRAGKAGVEACRSAGRAYRRVRNARNLGQWQATYGGAGRGCSAGRRYVPLHGGLGDQARRHDDSAVGVLYAGRELSRLYFARAGGRGGADYSVEFSAADGGVETGSGAGFGM